MVSCVISPMASSLLQSTASAIFRYKSNIILYFRKRTQLVVLVPAGRQTDNPFRACVYRGHQSVPCWTFSCCPGMFRPYRRRSVWWAWRNLLSSDASVFRLGPSVFSIRLLLQHLNTFLIIPKRKECFERFSDKRKQLTKRTHVRIISVKGCGWYGKWDLPERLSGEKDQNSQTGRDATDPLHADGGQGRETELPWFARTRWIFCIRSPKGNAIVIYGRKNKRNQVISCRNIIWKSEMMADG